MRILLCTCPHAKIYVSAYCCTCVLILLYTHLSRAPRAPKAAAAATEAQQSSPKRASRAQTVCQHRPSLWGPKKNCLCVSVCTFVLVCGVVRSTSCLPRARLERRKRDSKARQERCKREARERQERGKREAGERQERGRREARERQERLKRDKRVTQERDEKRVKSVPAAGYAASPDTPYADVC